MKNLLVIALSFLMINVFSQQSIDTTLTQNNSSLFTDDYIFDYKDTDCLKKIVSLRFSSLFDNDLLATNELGKVYNSLSLKDKEKIDNIVRARKRKSTSGLPQSLRLEDSF